MKIFEEIVFPIIKRTIRDILVNTIDQVMYANCEPPRYGDRRGWSRRIDHDGIHIEYHSKSGRR